mmetsp:Transcript_56641/g.120266  ORF Transcript_56641/g.120266 Transcript_56641/m.120266 type:complete len:122 (+) Transcript_56641:402-767(+)
MPHHGPAAEKGPKPVGAADIDGATEVEGFADADGAAEADGSSEVDGLSEGDDDGTKSHSSSGTHRKSTPSASLQQTFGLAHLNSATVLQMSYSPLPWPHDEIDSTQTKSPNLVQQISLRKE